MNSIMATQKLTTTKYITKMIRPTINQCVETFNKNIKGRTFFCPTQRNKGKAGLLLEGLLGIPTSGECWDCQDGEIKAFPQVLAGLRSRIAIPGTYGPKETVAVTMCSKPEIELAKSWAESRVRKKLLSVLFVGYVRHEDNVLWHESALFDQNHEMFQQLEADYASIQEYYIENRKTSGKIGKFLQVRTKGPGGDKKSWAFYLRKQFLLKLFGNSKE